MCRLVKCLAALCGAVLLPTAAYAQGSFAGVVKDASGAVLPGVTVEAASPVLIEKVRTAVTDGSGRYQIIDLRPGTYTVTFTLTGFNPIKRDGLNLSGAAVATIDADMKVGSLEETITVTGEAPTVDTQSATRQLVLNRDAVQLVPNGRQYYNLGTMVPGVNVSTTDIGGTLGDQMAQLTTHGSKGVDQRITNNGVNLSTLQAGGNIGGASPDVSSALEITVDTSAVSADLPTGGVRVNLIPRDGGNNFAGTAFFTFTNASLSGDNLTDKLKSLGLANVDKTTKNLDFNPAFGGPIKKDRLWFWTSVRETLANGQTAGAYVNKNAYKLDQWSYAQDTSTPAENQGRWHSIQTRMTFQLNAKNKIAGTYMVQNYCRCPDRISATVAPEAAPDRRFPRLRQEHVEWTSPVNNNLLLEVVGMHLFERWGNMHPRADENNFFHTGGSLPADFEQIAPLLIPVLDQTTGTLYRGGPAANGLPTNNLFNNTRVPNYFYRAAASYVTGTHNVKVGINNTIGTLDQYFYQFQPYVYRVTGGLTPNPVPNLVTVFATPYHVKSDEDMDLGLFVQDRYTINRLTLSGGLRFDHLKTSFPEQVVGPAALAPTRNITFPAADDINWKDVTYRSAASWDVFGTGKTAMKVTLNKYLNGQTLNLLGSDPNPVNTLVNSATRSWADANGNFVPDCVLDASVPGANGECGAISDPNLGRISSRPAATFSQDLLTGWGHRNFNWEFSTSVQHEILPRVSVDVGYFRRWFGNFRVTDDLAVAPADFNTFSLTAPTDSRLGDNSGKTITGLFNLAPAAFGRPAQNLNELASEAGARMIEHWNGMDLAIRARLQNGLTAQGGVSTGKRTTDACDLVSTVPEYFNAPLAVNLGDNNPATWLPGGFCHQEEPFLTSFTGTAIYTVPRIDVLLTGSFRTAPGPLVAANFVATNAILATSSTLGRVLSGNAANMQVNIAQPGSLYAERLTEFDMRFGKILRQGRSRTTVNLDLYNLFNSDTVRAVNNSYGSWLAAGPRPTTVLLPRFAKITATFDF